jgi:putative ABC transport system permease protein
MSREPEPGASWPGLRRVFRLPANQRRVHDEVSDELWFHIEERIEEFMTNGLSRDQAEAEVRRRFGDVTRVADDLEQIDAATYRRRDRGEWVHSVGRDVRYALRGMARRPGYTAVVVLTLALGIGANTAVFSAVNAALLRPLPTPWLERLVVIRDDLPGLGLRRIETSVAETEDLAERTDLFQTVGGFSAADFNLTGVGEPQRVRATHTVGGFFDVFGVRPHLGRLYRPDESEGGRHQVAILSYAFWQELGGDRDIIGRRLQLNGLPFEVVGVLPSNFRYPRTGQLWMPYPIDDQVRQRRGTLNITTVARLRPGVTWERLEAGLSDEARRWRERFGASGASRGAAQSGAALVPIPFVEFVAGQLRLVLLVLLGAVSFVLLIACANVASLQLVRAAGRTKEIAVRAALGAGRWAIARQSLVESLAVALLGGLLGLVLGQAILRLLARSGATHYEVLREVRLDSAVLGYAAFVVLLVGLIFGIGPALRASKVDIDNALRDAGRGASGGVSRHRFLQGSVVVQLALTLVLLLGSGLMIRSLARLLETDPGFRPEQLLTFNISLPRTRYTDYPPRLAFYGALERRLKSTPGIQGVGITSDLPITESGSNSPFSVVGRPSRPGEPQRHANGRFASAEYFKTMGIPLHRGRGFADSDGPESPPVALVDEQLAKQYFGGDDPIGERIQHFGPETEIVGIVGSTSNEQLGDVPKATVYYPLSQLPVRTVAIVVRSALPVPAAAGLVRSAVRELDRDLPVYDVQPMQQRIERSLGPRRLAMVVLSSFAGLSLVLALLGTYGVISYAVSQQTKEIGIRVALGAEPRDVVTMVLRTGLALTAVGLLVGTLAFIGLARVLRALLYGVGAHDPPTMLAGVAILAGVALLACYVPARRAARVDPVAALREE